MRRLMESDALRHQEIGLADGQRLRAIFEEQAGFVWRTLRHLGVPQVDLEDATQEVFLVVHARLAEYKERDKVRSWLYAICIRVAQRYKRTAARRRELVTDEPPERELQPTQQQGVEQREALALGRALVAALPEPQRTVFVLYEIERLSMAEVAEALGCPLQTAYARLHKARERIIEEVEARKRRGELP